MLSLTILFRLIEPARRMWRLFSRLGAAALALLAALALPLEAGARGLIRDSEVERTLKMLIEPIFTAANVPTERVRIFIINDDSLNAFVNAGSNMFFHTGLLRELEAPEELIGVMAHETGHIQAGHFVQRVEAIKSAQTAGILTTLIGIGAAAAGAGGAGAGVAQGGQRILQRQIAKFTRGQETGADALALQYMNKAGVNPEGLLQVMQRLRDRQPVFVRDPYVLSHPLGAQRIAALLKGVQSSPVRGKPATKEMIYWHGRMRAKLDGFLSAPGSAAVTRYGDPEFDLYRRAIELHRAPRPDEAIAAADKLIKMRPKDPFYWELKGQILFESGRGGKAVGPYERALQYAPNEPLIAAGLGKALLTLNTPKANKRALEILKKAAIQDPYDPGLRRPLARAYALNGQEGWASVVTAERLALAGRIGDAHRQARRAQAQLPAGSPGWRRAEDVLSLKPRGR